MVGTPKDGVKLLWSFKLTEFNSKSEIIGTSISKSFT